MEYVPGGSLTKLLEKTQLSEKLKGNILLDIAKGLLFLHNNNIYHRDLKPDNVLVMSSFEGANQNVKLTDFVRNF
jgi:serine/threonine protein kinase